MTLVKESAALLPATTRSPVMIAPRILALLPVRLTLAASWVTLAQLRALAR